MRKRVLISVDTEVHRRVRVAAIQLGVSVSKVYENGAVGLLNMSAGQAGTGGRR